VLFAWGIYPTSLFISYNFWDKFLSDFRKAGLGLSPGYNPLSYEALYYLGKNPV
jgi:hypothetical protein